MRPSMHFSGVYGNIEDDKSSAVAVTINPMGTSSKVKEREADQNTSKKKKEQHEQLKKFFEKNKDKYSDEDDMRLLRECVFF